MGRVVLGLAVLSLVGSVAAAPGDGATTSPADRRPLRCEDTGNDRDEPPCNPHLAQTVWAANHRNGYAQGSSPFPGPTGPPERIDVHHEGVVGDPIVLTFSPEYPDGGYVAWGSTVGPTGEVFKLDPDSFTVIDEFRPQLEGGEAPQEAGMTGAYNVLDRDNHLIVARQQALEVYGDANPDDRLSDVARLHRFTLPDAAFCRPGSDESLIGINMTYDGQVAFATSLGNVGVVPRQVEDMHTDNLTVHRLNGQDCEDPDTTQEDLEEVANTLAVDEDGGIYVITGAALHRVDWDGNSLMAGWRVGYDSDRGSGGSLGPGSGASPTLMGTRPEDDEFVVIYDDETVFNLMLVWRDRIPEDWEGLPGEDRRVACKVPVDFGRDDDATFSEQSPLVRGHGVVLVNDRMTAHPLMELVPSRAAGWTQLAGGVPGNEPRGVERIDWDPETHRCTTTWERPDLAIPNTIPTMSAATDTFYAVGVRDGTWTLEALHWSTGQQRFTVPTSFTPTQNSLWAATTVGPDGTVWSGTFGGVTRWQPCTGEDCGRRPGPVEHVLGSSYDPTS